MRRLLTWIAVATVLYFFGRFLFTYIPRAAHATDVMDPWLLVLALLPVFGAFGFQVLAWRSSFTIHGTPLSTLLSAYLYCTAVLTAYIPGKIPGILITAQLATDRGYSRLASSLAIVMYQVVSIIAGAALSLLFLATIADAQRMIVQMILAGVIMLAGIIVIHPKSINWVLTRVARLIKRDVGTAMQTSFGQNLRVFLLLSISWLLIALTIHVIRCAAVGNLEFDGFSSLAAIFLLSQVLGSAVIFLPSGLGVFEVALYVGLSHVFSEREAITVVATARLFMVMPALTIYALLNVTGIAKDVASANKCAPHGSGHD